MYMIHTYEMPMEDFSRQFSLSSEVLRSLWLIYKQTLYESYANLHVWTQRVSHFDLAGHRRHLVRTHILLKAGILRFMEQAATRLNHFGCWDEFPEGRPEQQKRPGTCLIDMLRFIYN